jgi:FkbM family methyltransferase
MPVDAAPPFVVARTRSSQLAFRETMKNLVRRLVPRAVRNALRRPSRTLGGIIEEAAFKLGRRSTCEVRPDWTVECHPGSRRAFLLHRDDPELRSELHSFVTRCRPGMVFYDVGAHYGIFTLAALRYGDGARVVSVEPSTQAARLLRINASMATTVDRVQVIEAAAGATDGFLNMLTTGANAEHYMIGTDDVRPDVTRLPQRTLAGIASATSLEPTHVKIDVEGFEGEVIDGARELLARARPTVFLELHGDILRQRGRSPREVLAKLESIGYRTFERDERTVAADEAATTPIVRLVCVPSSDR